MVDLGFKFETCKSWIGAVYKLCLNFPEFWGTESITFELLGL